MPVFMKITLPVASLMTAICGVLCLSFTMATASETVSKKTKPAPDAVESIVVDAAYLAKAAARIDALVNENLKKHN